MCAHFWRHLYIISYDQDIFLSCHISKISLSQENHCFHCSYSSTNCSNSLLEKQRNSSYDILSVVNRGGNIFFLIPVFVFGSCIQLANLFIGMISYKPSPVSGTVKSVIMHKDRTTITSDFNIKFHCICTIFLGLQQQLSKTENYSRIEVSVT